MGGFMSNTTDINKLMKEQEVSAEVMKQCLNTGIYDVSKTHVFISGVLQCLNISYSHMLDTAGVSFNSDLKRWDLFINPHFFCMKLNQPQRKAILLHEVAHITNRHPFRVPFLKIHKNKRTLMNIGADMAINCYIKDLPAGCPQCPPLEAQQAGQPCPNKLCPGHCIDINNYYDLDDKGNKVPWKPLMTMEYYYEKLIEKFKDMISSEDGEGEEGECGTCGGTGKDPKDSTGNTKCPDCNGTGKAKAKGKGKGLPKEYDSHNWDGNAEEAEMLDATEELMKRAMVKQSLSYDQLPGSIQSLLEDIIARKSELNYKAIILSAIKRHASGHERKSTWTRKSKRFGAYAPGTKIGDLPKLSLYLDSSGSISTEELNEFLDIVDQFLKNGARKCEINLFHTKNYYSSQYKLGERFDPKKVKSGGTDLTDSFQRIINTKPDLAIFITDGYYSRVDYEKMLKPNQKLPQTLFIISRQGQEKHPMDELPTVKIPETSKLKEDKDLENK